uniref:FH2 domain-containing protein n=1 Tax=Gasterosteus aculeatus aculeatus TaxID=481459 RepID=A0AAQ4NMS7_GASAC
MLLQAQSIDYNPLSQGNGAEYRKNFGGRSAGAMTEPDGAEDAPPTWAFDRSFRKPAARLCLNALDFSDLWDEEDGEEDDGAVPTSEPPAPPGAPPAPPPLPPPTTPAPPLPSASRRGEESIKCHTLRLHWRELQSLAPLPRMTRFGTRTIWETLEPVHLDTDRLEHLFKSKGSSSSFNVASGRQPLVSVLGMKRSNIITIALSSLPPPRLLPPAIYSMDSSVLDREDRLKALVPTEEELRLIEEAKAQDPHSPLAPAELCLLTLGGIPHLTSRLQLWAFALDYDSLEREIAEPLFHLKLAMKQLAASQTFRCILATVLAIGNFLNGCKARGFELSYLGKLSQVRDTHTRQPLLLHVCALLLQLYPQSTDLHSDIAAVAKFDFSLVRSNLTQLEALCKASWEQLKNATEGSLRQRLPQILKECEERLKVLRAVHRRVINRFHSFLLFLGYSRAMVRDTKAEDFCKTISDFSLEYRTTRQAFLLQRDRERRKGAAESPGAEALEEVLRTVESDPRLDATLPRARRRMADITGAPRTCFLSLSVHDVSC